MLREKDIVKSVQKEFNLTKNEASNIVSHIFKLMMSTLVKWADVQIRNFFTMHVFTTFWRDLNIVTTGEFRKAEDYSRVACRFTPAFKNEVKKNNKPI